MFKNQSQALKYIVKVTYDTTASEGSAILIPILDNNEYAYIFTAKHTFGLNNKEQSDSGYHTIDIETIDKTCIHLTNPENHKFEILQIISLENNPEIDLLIFQIKKDDYIKKISPLHIYEDSFHKALIYGYPNMKKEDYIPYQPILGTYTKISEKNKFELYLKDFPNIDEKQSTHDYVEGLSGAGIFVEDIKKEEIYLSGIVINSGAGNTIKCIDILEISNIINKKLIEQKLCKLHLSGAKWKDKLGFDIADLNFKDITLELSSKYKKNKFMKELISCQDKKDAFIEKFDNSVKVPLNKEIIKLSEASQIYLYIAMKFHIFNENTRATAYFNKAIEYGGNKNKSYLLTAKAKREEKKNKQNRDKQETELILKIIENLYDEMYEYEEQLKSNPDDESLKKMLKDCYIELREKLSFFDDRDYEIKEIYKKFMDLNFNEKDNLQEQIFELKDMIKMSQEFQGMRKQVNDYQKEIENLNRHIQLLSKNISDKTLLNKINYQVFNTDKKLDEVSVNLSHKIDGYSDKIDKKLDIVIGTIKKTNNKKIDNVLEKVCTSNRALINKIQTMYHQNDRVNKRAKIALKKSIDEMNEKLDTLSVSSSVSDNYSLNTQEIKNIIEKSNWNFYQGIKKLYESEQDSYNRKLLEMSIAFTRREHELHIENLEQSNSRLLEEKNKEIIALKKSIDELALYYQDSKEELKQNSKEFIALREKYDNIKAKIANNPNTLTDVERLEYEEEIENLKKSIERLKNQDEILNNIHDSINTLVYEPLDKEDFEKISIQLDDLDIKLENMEDRYLNQIDKLEKRFNRIVSNPKNIKRLKQISRQIHGFENKLEEIKKEKRGNPKITLHLLESDLKKIESIMRERRLPIYHLYCSVRNILQGGILLGALVILFLNEPCKTLISEIEFSKVFRIFKDVP